MATIRFHAGLIAVSLGLSVIIYLAFIYINVGRFDDLQPLSFYLKDGWAAIGTITSLVYFLVYTLPMFDRRHAKAPNSFRRFIEEIFFVFIIGFLITELFRFLLIAQLGPEQITERARTSLRQLQMVNFIVLASLYGFMTSLRIFRYLKQKQVELLRIQKEFAQSRFEALKNQLNPHFLFNSLSTLSSLVYIDGQVAETFVVKLSKTYRYILEQKDKELVPLEQELDFLGNYLFLLQQRFGNKLEVRLHNHDCPPSSLLPPHTLMIVLEHIINTQAMSSKQPLVIEISCSPQAIRITHSLQPKAPANQATEEQFDRLASQYAFLGRERLRQRELGEQTEIHLPIITQAA